MAAAARAALVSVVVVAAACSSPGRGPVARPDTSSTRPPAPTSTTEPPPVYEPSPYSWERATVASSPPAPPGPTLAAISAPTPGQPWMAVGVRAGAGGIPVAAVWTSADGVSWTATDLINAPGQVAVEEAGQASSLAEYRNQTIIGGSVGQGADQQAAIWVQPAPDSPFQPAAVPLTGGASRVTQVAAGPLGMFATGTVDGRFALWSSTDGAHWSEQPGIEKVFGSSAGARVLTLLEEGGRVYAAGSIEAAGVESAAVWSSGDGLDWSLVGGTTDQFGGPGARVIFSLAPLGTGVVAVGAQNEGTGWTPASWISPNGVSWSPPSTDFPGLPAPDQSDPSSGAAARAVAAVSTLDGSVSLVAVGGGPGAQQAWRSSDGVHWTPAGLPAAAVSATGWRATLVAATQTDLEVADGDPGQAHLLTYSPGPGWREPSSDPALFGPVEPTTRPVAVTPVAAGLEIDVRTETDPQRIGSAAYTYSTVVSDVATDEQWAAGRPWTSGPATLPSPSAKAVSVPGGWVAAAGGEPAPGWTSPTGSNWTVSGSLTSGAQAPPSQTLVAGVCSQGATVVAVGSGTPSASPDEATTTGYGGRLAQAWASVEGLGWKRASVAPAPPSSSTELMAGCTQSGRGLLAFGTSTGSSGQPLGAFWTSDTGSVWTRLAVLPTGPPFVISAAAEGDVVVAASNPDPAGGPRQTYGAGAVSGPGPESAALSDVSVGPPDSLGDGQGRDGLWVSEDGGSTWRQIDTSTLPWLGTEQSSIDLVGWDGSSPVVAGTVDGHLAIWYGTLAPAAG